MEIDTVLHTEKYRAAFGSTLECLVLYRNEDAIAYCINDTTHLLSYGALMKSEDAIVIHNRKAIKAIREQCAEFLARSGITVSEEKSLSAKSLPESSSAKRFTCYTRNILSIRCVLNIGFHWL